MAADRAPTISDYDAIAAAIGQTSRGRWFLEEHLRRHRSGDAACVMEALDRLEAVIARDRPPSAGERIRANLMEMADAIARTRMEIAAVRAPERAGPESPLVAASEALDGIVHTTERATSAILDAAESIQEAAWTLREAGIESRLCDDLDRRATEIYTACTFQDLTAQRTRKVVHTLRFLERRIHGLIALWREAAGDATGLACDEARGTDLCQRAVDALVAEPSQRPAPAAAAPSPAGALAALDALTTEETLRKFT